MKNIFIVTFVFLYIGANAQSKMEKISYISPAKDTLILPNDTLGQEIAKAWININPRICPVILFADEALIRMKNEELIECLKD